MEIISLTGIHPTIDGTYNFVSLDELATATEVVAVKVDGATHADALGPYTSKLGLVEIQFENFSDGRGFSLSYRLRRDYGFKGEIRISGPVIPDQAHMLQRAGADTLVLDKVERREDFFKALNRFNQYYQHSIHDELAVPMRRHVAPKARQAS